MIRQIRGVVSETGLGYVVLETGNIGYLVRTNASAALPVGAEVLLHTHLAVRENAHDLYGFLEQEELFIFELLIELPKIGPKSALQILIQADTRLLKEAVLNNDPKYLSKLSGIGKKSAEKIVLGLRDKFEAEGLSDDYARSGKNADKGHAPDTVDALITLGYSERDARTVVQQISLDNPEVRNSAEALKIALRILSN